MCLILIKHRSFIIISLVLMYTNQCTSVTSKNNTTVEKPVNKTIENNFANKPTTEKSVKETSTTESTQKNSIHEQLKQQLKMSGINLDSLSGETQEEEMVTLIPMPKLNKTMKAIVLEEFGSPANFKVKEIPIPEPNEYEILVQVKAVGLNFVDTQMRSGKFGKLPTLPAILGKEAAGIVVRNGNKTAEFSVGERVLCCFTGTGAYAEYVVCRTSYVVRLGDKLTFQQASTLYVSYFTAYRALIQKAQLKKGEIVYIHGGTGGFGIAALQIAKSYSCKVISSYGSLEGRDLLIKLGADHVHSHKVQGHSIQGFLAAGIKGYDVVLETTANLNLAEACFSLNKNGRVVVVGSKGDVQINPYNLILKETSINGVMLSKTPELDFFNAYIAIVKGINDGWVEPVIERVYKPEEIEQAHIDMEKKTKTLGKFVLEF